ncbi:RIO1 family-domain-containing protein [Gymnopilus junonius]|uniref:Serine/threonine-protein kinase RIO2 n=1 Tax=Gymnopilus junonius TaxID=109634 RepID=A0A9P5TT24_GYMJU|nr:RIO1 family-domain-containing protein [Gymnopilus junonius]
MKLDATDLRYVTSDEFRVLTAVEMGSKNHEVVPLSLIVQISGLRNGGVNKLVGSLAKRNLISKMQNSKYDGYRLTYGGYDYLAMRALSKRDSMSSVGNQVGVGKESGKLPHIYIVADADGNEMVLKLHRLGRVSFRAIKSKRDYLGKRKSASWMYMSRLSAQKEWAFMKILHEHGFPVPRPIDQSRHCVLMEFIDAYPLRQVSEVENPGKLYSTLMDVIVRFAQAGLIHGDYNEFNILIKRETGEPIVIDFPQMVSTSHENAEWYFNRDVECIKTFFKRRFRYESSLYPRFRKVVDEEPWSGQDSFRLDVMVEASGFGRREMKVLEEYMESVREEEQGSSEPEEDMEEEDEDEETGDEEDRNAEKADIVLSGPKTFEARTVLHSTHQTSSISGPSVEDPDTLKLEELGISDLSDDRLSRSPPQSRRESPLEELDEVDDPSVPKADIKSKVASDISKRRAQQQRKYHSKRSTRSAGRAQGSKAKQDTRVKLNDHGGVWG